MTLALFAATALPGVLAADAVASANPLAKTIELLEALKAKIVGQDEAEAKAFGEYMEWCDDTTKNGAFLIKSLYAKKAKAAACIDKSNACIENSATTTEELAASIATAEGEL